jgi:hypothetical protein
MHVLPYSVVSGFNVSHSVPVLVDSRTIDVTCSQGCAVHAATFRHDTTRLAHDHQDTVRVAASFALKTTRAASVVKQDKAFLVL